jgi:hypothetical protein
MIAMLVQLLLRFNELNDRRHIQAYAKRNVNGLYVIIAICRDYTAQP